MSQSERDKRRTISFEDVMAKACRQQTQLGSNSPALDLETALRDCLTEEQLRDLTDSALTRISAMFGPSGNGHAIELVGKVAGEQARRVLARSRRTEWIATQALQWSRWTFFVSLIAAAGIIVALFKL